MESARDTCRGVPAVCRSSLVRIVGLTAAVCLLLPLSFAGVWGAGGTSGPETAFAAASSNSIHLRVGSFDPVSQRPAVPVPLGQGAIAVNEDYYIVQFRGTVLPEWRAAIEAIGGTLYGYVPTHAYLVKLARPLVHEVRQLSQVRWVGLYEPGYRVSPELFDALDSSSEVPIVVSTFERDELPGVLAVVSEEQGEVLDSAGPTGNSVRARVKGRSIARLAQIKGVAWVEEFVPYELFNDVAGGIIGADDVWTVPGVSGVGQIVAVADTGLDVGVGDTTVHPDFYGRIVEGQAWGRSTWDDPDGHGTHVAGSVLGDGTQSSGLYAGVAPSANLVMQSVLDEWNGLGGIPADLRDLFGAAYDAGARIHTNSWGANVSGVYTTDSWNVDRYVWDHKDVTILFSAGNKGVDSDKDGVVDADSIGSPGTAKNCITVGASENDRPSLNFIYGSTSYGSPISSDYLADDPGGIAGFSSRGPTNDGRMKPDLVAPGTFVCSARTRRRAIDEGFESGSIPGDWSADAGWGVYSGDSRAGTYSLANGTPEAGYGTDLNSYVVLPTLDLQAYDTGPYGWIEVGVWMKFNVESDGDQGFLLIDDQRPGQGWYGYALTGATDWTLVTYRIDPAKTEDWSAVGIAIGLETTSANSGGPYYFLADDVRVYSLSGWRPADPYIGLSTDGTVIDESYQFLNGTSMATPLTAGGVALLREHFMYDEGVGDPSAALLKATLIAAAEDLTPGQYGTGSTQEIQGRPDRAQGWGRVNLKNAIAPAAPAVVLYADSTAGLAQSETESFVIDVTDDSVPLRVALVWTDPAPASPSVSPQLVNDLDLTVTDPSMVDHVAMGGSGDHVNNVEFVEIASPGLGTYTIEVEGHDVNGPDQPFAVVMYGAGEETAPEVSAADPASGSQGVMSLDVGITGLHTGFVDGVSEASFSGTGIRVNGTTVVDATHAVTNINIDLSAPLGLRDITVTTGEEVASGAEVFEVTLSTLSVSVAPGTWEIGAAEAGAVLTTWTAATAAQGGYFQVKNDGSTAASLMLGTADSESWTPGSTAGPDTFVVGWGQTATQGNEPSYTVVTTGGVALVTDLSASGSFDFDLQCLAPTSTSDPLEQYLPVIVGAQP